MQGYFAALTLVLLLGMVLSRVFVLGRAGTRAMHGQEYAEYCGRAPRYL